MSNYDDLDIPCYEELKYVNNPFTEIGWKVMVISLKLFVTLRMKMAIGSQELKLW